MLLLDVGGRNRRLAAVDLSERRVAWTTALGPRRPHWMTTPDGGPAIASESRVLVIDPERGVMRAVTRPLANLTEHQGVFAGSHLVVPERRRADDDREWNLAIIGPGKDDVVVVPISDCWPEAMIALDEKTVLLCGEDLHEVDLVGHRSRRVLEGGGGGFLLPLGGRRVLASMGDRLACVEIEREAWPVASRPITAELWRLPQPEEPGAYPSGFEGVPLAPRGGELLTHVEGGRHLLRVRAKDGCVVDRIDVGTQCLISTWLEPIADGWLGRFRDGEQLRAFHLPADNAAVDLGRFVWPCPVAAGKEVLIVTADAIHRRSWDGSDRGTLSVPDLKAWPARIFGRVLVGAYGMEGLFGVDMQSGAVLWTGRTHGLGLRWVPGATNLVETVRGLFIVDPERGVRRSRVPVRFAEAYPHAAANGLVAAIVSTARRCALVVADPESGRERWRVALQQQSPEAIFAVAPDRWVVVGDMIEVARPGERKTMKVADVEPPTGNATMLGGDAVVIAHRHELVCYRV